MNAFLAWWEPLSKYLCNDFELLSFGRGKTDNLVVLKLVLKSANNSIQRSLPPFFKRVSVCCLAIPILIEFQSCMGKLTLFSDQRDFIWHYRHVRALSEQKQHDIFCFEMVMSEPISETYIADNASIKEIKRASWMLSTTKDMTTFWITF